MLKLYIEINKSELKGGLNLFNRRLVWLFDGIGLIVPQNPFGRFDRTTCHPLLQTICRTKIISFFNSKNQNFNNCSGIYMSTPTPLHNNNINWFIKFCFAPPTQNFEPP